MVDEELGIRTSKSAAMLKIGVQSEEDMVHLLDIQANKRVWRSEKYMVCASFRKIRLDVKESIFARDLGHGHAL